MKVGIIGAGGYAGGELLRLLSRHPEVGEIVAGFFVIAALWLGIIYLMAALS